MKYVHVTDETFLWTNNDTTMHMNSDGGMREKKCNFRIMLQCDNKKVLHICCCVPKIYKDVNSHCSECFGLLISTQIIILLQQYLKLQQQIIVPYNVNVNLYCDIKSSGNTVNKLMFIILFIKNTTSPLYGFNIGYNNRNKDGKKEK
jgi:hypothetical protein